MPIGIGRERPGTAPQVRALQDYLGRFGYLKPERETQLTAARASFAAAAPLAVSARPLPKASAGTFDEATAQALASFQTFYGLPPTGRFDMATASLMSHPRCGVPDVPRVPRAGGPDAFVARGRWQKTELTYAFQNFTKKLTKDQVRGAIKLALGLWAKVSQLRFTEVEGGTPDLLIGFFRRAHDPRCPPFDGPGGVLAHAYYPPPLGGPISGHAHFDDEERWSVDLPATGTDLVTVAAHELGHALGLDHSPIRGALMFAYYAGGANRFLHADDVSGIQSLYGAALPSEGGGGPQDGGDGPAGDGDLVI